MTIRILNYWPELLGRLQGLVEVEGSDLLLDISDPVPLRSFAGLSSDRVYRQWSTQNGIYLILRQQRVANIGMSAPDDPEEDGLSGRVSAHACAAAGPGLLPGPVRGQIPAAGSYFRSPHRDRRG